MFSQPPACLSTQHVVENDLQRPRFQQVGDAFADDSESPESKRFAMRAEQVG